MYTFNHDPALMIRLATTIRDEQRIVASRHRDHRTLRTSARARGGYWGGLRRRRARAADSSARIA